MRGACRRVRVSMEPRLNYVSRHYVHAALPVSLVNLDAPSPVTLLPHLNCPNKKKIGFHTVFQILHVKSNPPPS